MQLLLAAQTRRQEYLEAGCVGFARVVLSMFITIFVGVVQLAVATTDHLDLENLIVDGLTHLEDAPATKVATLRPDVDNYEGRAAEADQKVVVRVELELLDEA